MPSDRKPQVGILLKGQLPLAANLPEAAFALHEPPYCGSVTGIL